MKFCDKNIYSFEATQTNFKLMQQALKLNNSSRIIPINKGLGAKKKHYANRRLFKWFEFSGATQQ